MKANEQRIDEYGYHLPDLLEARSVKLLWANSLAI